MPTFPIFLIFGGILFVGACTSIPTAPSVMVLPGTGKSFEQFRSDDATCREFAFEQIGGVVPARSSNESMAKSAITGTAVGAVAGAAVGGSRSAGIGAGTGLVVGSMAGAAASETSGYGSQRRYDYAFIQCMYAKGHRVPISGQMTSSPIAPPPPPPLAPR